MTKTPMFPLARLIPLGVLTVVAAISAVYIASTDEHANHWAAVSLLPLLVYLGRCHFRARKIILAEHGRERDIVKTDLVAMAAERSAQFWTFLFSVVALSTCLTALAVWAYQGYLWNREGDWIPLTWLSIGGAIPHSDFSFLQRSIYWLGDTNLGVIVLIAGLLLAAPLVAINAKSQHKAKLCRKDLANLKKRS